MPDSAQEDTERLLQAMQQATTDHINRALGIPQTEASIVVPPNGIPLGQLQISQAIVNDSDRTIIISARQEGRQDLQDLRLYQREAIEHMTQQVNHPWYIRNGVPEDVVFGLDPGQMDIQVAGRTHRINDLTENERRYISQMDSIVTSLKTKCDKLYKELEEAYSTINSQDQMLVDLRAKVKELVQPAPLVRAKIDMPLKPYKH